MTPAERKQRQRFMQWSKNTVTKENVTRHLTKVLFLYADQRDRLERAYIEDGRRHEMPTVTGNEFRRDIAQIVADYLTGSFVDEHPAKTDEVGLMLFGKTWPAAQTDIEDAIENSEK